MAVLHAFPVLQNGQYQFVVNPLKLHDPSMLPDKAKFVECSIISLALPFWMKHLVISKLQKPAKFSAFQLVTISKSGFHWPAFGNQQGSTFTETNRNGLTHHIGCLITLSDGNGPILVLVLTDFDHTGCLITLSDRNRPILDLVYPILDYILYLVSTDFSGPNHRIGQGCAGRA